MAHEDEGVLGRPRLSDEEKPRLAARFGLPAEGLVFKDLPSYDDVNMKVETSDGRRYVLKVHNSTLPNGTRERLEAENRLIARFAEKGLPVFSVLHAAEGPIVELEGTAKGQRGPLARMITFIDGDLVPNDTPKTAEFLQGVGEIAGRVATALDGFDDPAAHWTWSWDMKNVAKSVEERLHFVKDEKRRALAERLTKEYKEVLSEEVLASLPHAVIHADLNDTNLIFDTDHKKLVGIIDFGDSIYGCRAFEPAIAAGYYGLGQADPMAVLQEVLKGYTRAAPTPLSNQEVACYFQAARGRVLLSVVMSAEGCSLEPDNEYLAHTSEPGWAVLEKLGSLDKDAAVASLKEALSSSKL